MARGTNPRAWYSPSNIADAFDVLTDKTRQDAASDNPSAMIGWMTAFGYVLGNSLGTANTNAGRTRFKLGPVYFW